MAANMGKPCPVDPISYRWECKLLLRCTGCGHTNSAKLSGWARRFSVGHKTQIYVLAGRMVCGRCGARQPEYSVI